MCRRISDQIHNQCGDVHLFVHIGNEWVCFIGPRGMSEEVPIANVKLTVHHSNVTKTPPRAHQRGLAPLPCRADDSAEPQPSRYWREIAYAVSLTVTRRRACNTSVPRS